MYGPDGAYRCFAGREATRALAKLSFEESDLSNPKYDDLGPFERDTLQEWIDKFKYYRCYPIIGKVSVPPHDLEFKRADLTQYKGKQDIPIGRIDAPIYLGINRKVLDVSYGGKDHYGEGDYYYYYANYIL